MSTSTKPRRQYRIVTTANLKPGDIIKISRRRVENVEPHPRGVAVKLAGLRHPSVFFGTEKIGVYRTATPAILTPATPVIEGRYYPVRIAQDGSKIRKGGSGPWYVYDSIRGEIPVWVSHNTKRSAQMAADARNADTPAAPTRHLAVVR